MISPKYGFNPINLLKEPLQQGASWKLVLVWRVLGNQLRKVLLLQRTWFRFPGISPDTLLVRRGFFGSLRGVESLGGCRHNHYFLSEQVSSDYVCFLMQLYFIVCYVFKSSPKDMFIGFRDKEGREREQATPM